MKTIVALLLVLPLCACTSLNTPSTLMCPPVNECLEEKPSAFIKTNEDLARAYMVLQEDHEVCKVLLRSMTRCVAEHNQRVKEYKPFKVPFLGK